MITKYAKIMHRLEYKVLAIDFTSSSILVVIDNSTNIYTINNVSLFSSSIHNYPSGYNVSIVVRSYRPDIVSNTCLKLKKDNGL